MSASDAQGLDPSPRILVTGDIVRETHFYQGRRRHASLDASDGFQVASRWGGAALLHQLLDAAAPGVARLGLEWIPGVSWPHQLEGEAIYAACKAGFKSDPPPPEGKTPPAVWRVKDDLGFGASPRQQVPPAEPPLVRTHGDGPPPPVLVIDDGSAGFRTLRARERWPDGGDTSTPLSPWVVLKLTHPVCEGHLWRHLQTRCAPGAATRASRLVVLVSADELRRNGAAINRGLSWERTISDTCDTLTQNPRFTSLRRAAHLIIVYRREGALWLRNADPGLSPEAWPSRLATLLIDPRFAEGEWTSSLADDRGSVLGHTSVLTAALALELAQPAAAADPDAVDLGPAIERGLVASRQLRLLGHGPVKSAAPPDVPLRDLAPLLRPSADAPVLREPHQPPDKFVRLTLPCWDEAGGLGNLSADWTIAALDDGTATPAPLYGLAFQTAIYGPSRLSDVPHARFGALVSVDRQEIETLRSLRQLIQNYEGGGPQKSPLCLGAFGPPGAGKSFGIKQIAAEILGRDFPYLEFNLAQFSDPQDLIGGFHQVRDKVLGGRTPLVLWDEFDSQQLLWLQYFLAPMQDGRFQSGQLTHTLGKCIFVFAGATSWDFEHLDPACPLADADERQQAAALRASDPERQQALDQAVATFRLRKGPDFISRLDGYINVSGPNRRQRYNPLTRQWDRPDFRDVTFPVRRALLLRSLLKVDHTRTLDIDRDLLSALLRQPRYRHGTRSMEKTVAPLQLPHTPLRPAQLPPPQVLAQHLDSAADFQGLLTENAEFLTEANLQALAAAIHENFRRLFAQPGEYVPDPQFRETFSQLDAWGQATNLAAARGIPHVLAVAGLRVVRGNATPAEQELISERLRRFLDPLRQEEHARWMSYLRANDWLQAQEKDETGRPVRDNGRLLHNCLVPFGQLSAHDQEKDHAAILSLPQMVALVGFKLELIPAHDVPPRRAPASE